MPRKRTVSRRLKPRARRAPIHYEPSGWLSTAELEEELFAEVVTESRLPCANTRLERIDAYFAREEPGSELQYRRSLMHLLAGLRPQLAELVGGSHTYI